MKSLSAFLIRVLFLSGVLFSANSCNYAPVYSGTHPVASTRSFAVILSTILQPKCGTCHSPSLANGGVVVTSYQDIMSSPGTVVPFQPYESQVYWQCFIGKMPQDAAALSPTELKTLYDWIAYGAPNN